jgi:DNA mismatch repair protein MutS2
MSRLNREFVKLISRYKGEGFLADTVESIRNGRRVLCVTAEHKRQIRGIIHDESTTGRTVFIEPELIVEINNNIVELEAEYKKEVYRLLKELCQELRPYKEEIVSISELIHHWDLVQALALMGISYKAIAQGCNRKVHFI